MKPFKASLRRQWVDHIVKCVRETATPQRPSYKILSEWIAKAAGDVSKSSIISGLVKSGLIPEEHFETPLIEDICVSSPDEIEMASSAFATLTFDKHD